VGRDLALGKFADGFLKLELFVVELKIQEASGYEIGYGALIQNF